MHCIATIIKIPNLFTNPSIMPTKWLLIPHVKSSEEIQPTTDNMVTNLLRDMSNLDKIEPIIGSKNANVDVIPANNTARKNNGAKIWPINPIMSKILGNTTNINPVPSLTSCIIGVPEVAVIYPKIEKTPNAVKISKLEFDAITISTFSVNLASSGK